MLVRYNLPRVLTENSEEYIKNVTEFFILLGIPKLHAYEIGIKEEYSKKYAILHSCNCRIEYVEILSYVENGGHKFAWPIAALIEVRE